MANVLENKTIQKVAGVLAGAGALNWGLTKFVNIDLLSYIPGGEMVFTAAVAAIAISGGIVIYMVIKKKI